MIRLSIYLFIYFYCFLVIAEPNSDYLIKDQYSQSTYGSIGLIQTPTARFSNDGEFGFGVSSEAPYNRLYGKAQFFPWLEAVLRYTEGTHLGYYGDTFRISQTWKDKGLDIKIRLFEENTNRPELAVGFIDLGGTGSFGSEYLVASKRFGNIDWSIGLGWGSLGGVDHFDNIIGLLDNERKVRGGYGSYGGNINLKRFFSGEQTSVFGGFQYFTPIDNLSFKLEYDTSDYSSLRGAPIKIKEGGDIFELDSRFNYAMNYRVNLGEKDKLDLSLGFVRGNTMYANFSVHSNLNYKGMPKVTIGAEKIRNSNLPAKSFRELDQKWQTFLTNRIIKEMANNGFVTHKVIFDRNELSAEISQARFKETTKFLDLASKILSNNALQNIEKVTVINIDQGIETMRSSAIREEVRTAALNGPLPEDLFVFNEISRPSAEALVRNNDFLYPNFYWEIKPHLNTTFQHQIQFFFWQLEALIHTEYSIKKGLYLTTDIGIDITSNFKDYTYHIPDGQLHNVRQDRRLYLTEGKTGLRRMAFDYLVDLHPNLKGKLSAGYLEWMYGGIGGELLYMPDNKRWAIGVDTYWVKQRDYDQKFSFKDYETVTGFLSYYQDIPFYNMRLKLSMGKFLGKDVGAMIDVSRRFNNGARVGGFAALTDCNPACVGEGSFHKGVYFELPMDLFYVQSTTRNRTGYSWSPLTKNAGAKLETGGLYYLMSNATDEVDVLRQKSWSVKKIFSGFGVKPQSRKNLQ
jgi:hypothetical protein